MVDGVDRMNADRCQLLRIRVVAPILVCMGAALLGGGGCRSSSRPGRWVTCNCPYLTDFDDVAKHSLDVCVPPDGDAVKLAQDCASRIVHGPPEACTCGGVGGPCDGTESCRSNEYK